MRRPTHSPSLSQQEKMLVKWSTGLILALTCRRSMAEAHMVRKAMSTQAPISRLNISASPDSTTSTVNITDPTARAAPSHLPNSTAVVVKLIMIISEVSNHFNFRARYQHGKVVLTVVEEDAGRALPAPVLVVEAGHGLPGI